MNIVFLLVVDIFEVLVVRVVKIVEFTTGRLVVLPDIMVLQLLLEQQKRPIAMLSLLILPVSTHVAKQPLSYKGL